MWCRITLIAAANHQRAVSAPDNGSLQRMVASPPRKKHRHGMRIKADVFDYIDRFYHLGGATPPLGYLNSMTSETNAQLA
jgi:hypothetical protein